MVSRMPNPQSMRMRVPPTSTSRALPSLPLPRQAKRTPPSLELVLEQRQYLVAVHRALGAARGIFHRHDAARIGLRHDHPILLGLYVVAFPECKLVEKTFFFLRVEVRVRVAHEIQALGPIAVDDGEAGAI